MSLSLPKPSDSYDSQNEAQTRRVLAEADNANQKKANDFVVKNNRLILTSPDGTQWSGTIGNTGTVIWTAL